MRRILARTTWAAFSLLVVCALAPSLALAQNEYEQKALYTGPVVVLTSPRTFSAAEDFMVAYSAMKRGLIIGEPTGGSTGQPLYFTLPGGGGAVVCTKRDKFPDGREFVGRGIQPDKLVRPTIEDFRAGRDTVLEAALKELKSNPSGSAVAR